MPMLPRTHIARRRRALAGALLPALLGALTLGACNKKSAQPALVAAAGQSASEPEAPAQYHVRFETSRGPFVVEVNRAWAPRGADRLHNLVRLGYYDDSRFYRVVEGFMAQWGYHADPQVSKAWIDRVIPDDPITQSNRRGFVSFATRGPNTRSTQLFVNYADNAYLDQYGFAPVGRVVQGMEVVDSLYSEYGEGAPDGRGPDQERILGEGNAYLTREFPRLDYIRSARIAEAPR